MHDCVLMVGEVDVECGVENQPIDGCQLEQSEKRVDLVARPFGCETLGCDVVDRDRRRRANRPLDSAVVDQREELDCGDHVGLALKQDVEYHVGVEEDPHRHFSSR